MTMFLFPTGITTTLKSIVSLTTTLNFNALASSNSEISSTSETYQSMNATDPQQGKVSCYNRIIINLAITFPVANQNDRTPQGIYNHSNRVLAFHTKPCSTCSKPSMFGRIFYVPWQ